MPTPDPAILDDIARATGFLSRIPMPARHFRNYDGSLSRAVRMFPVAGLLVALAPALLAFGLSGLGAPPTLTALLVLGLLLVLTGALHEDGLADSADAFGAGGAHERMLAIMKDSRIGTYGALALILTVALRAAALSALVSELSAWQVAFAILAVAAASRSAMVWHWSRLAPARLDGVAASVGRPACDAVAMALVLGAAIGLVGALLASGWVAATVALGSMVAASWAWTHRCQSRLGGHTGDTIGATQQIAETTFLVALALLV